MKSFQTLALSLLTTTLFSSALIASPGAHGPNGEHLDQKASKTNGQLGRQDDGSVLMPMKHQALLKIRTQFAEVTKTRKHVQLHGTIKPHPDGFAIVQPSSDGRLDAPKKGMHISGTLVKAGEILGFIRYQYTAFDFANQTSDLVAVRNQIAQVKRDVDRLKNLGDLASKQELERLETQLTIFKQQEGVLEQGLEKSEALVAPIDGVLVNNSVSKGQWVEAGRTLFEIVSLDKFLVEATTSGENLSAELTTAKITQLPNVTVSYIGSSPQLVNGLVLANFESSSEIKPSHIQLNKPVTLQAPINRVIEGIVLPAKAVVLSPNNLPQVWIKLSAERFLPQIVEYEELEPGLVVITNGLGADNRVVVEGSSLLNQVR
ncbi:efflux RND transporter periplasmic adaptor subunit [Psychrosphaera ytuae]|uniref:Efflux RND transporter periplasmic adaptor subunit n=1 Tax=Psychrosphaera ytuae TaxID=2820710 RepID=A0A975DC62_9GAMM|nr:HlyD family efflux transporter periplasmic adaptor subunit [Psychrosphaera ytuae]QTH63626.1 efflux RND transporter periplasmic adaptor subunit [Psychrosphaera ytuae]